MHLQSCLLIKKLANIGFLNMSHRRLTSDLNLISEIKTIFNSSVQAVEPRELIYKSVCVMPNSVEIQGKSVLVNKNVYIVGFGKAVLGMAVALQDLLRDHIVSGIVSIPSGMDICTILPNKERFISQIKIFEGAKNNIPDQDSFLAANKIFELVTSLGESSILFALISGGGSALLPYPKPPLTLEEKQSVIKTLAVKGATIEEINVIRKRLSVLKGGGLAELAKPAQVVSLILSDIIGDPLGLIASGPTVKNSDDPILPLSIIEKYNIILPETAMKLLSDVAKNNKSNIDGFNHVSNFVVGNNSIALDAAAEKAKELLYKPIVMTTKLCGIASDIGCKVIQLIDAALQKNELKVKQICKELNIGIENADNLLLQTRVLEENVKGLCVLFGGETTVEVKGKGIGGRNQELAVVASLELYKSKSKNEIILLSAGTDGIDGPTDAAGAIATSLLWDIGKSEKIDVISYLNNNDSYNFYQSLQNGEYHVKIGHTGTNVMDVVIVLIKKL